MLCGTCSYLHVGLLLIPFALRVGLGVPGTLVPLVEGRNAAKELSEALRGLLLSIFSTMGSLMWTLLLLLILPLSGMVLSPRLQPDRSHMYSSRHERSAVRTSSNELESAREPRFYTFSCIFSQVVTDHCRYTTVDNTGDPNAVPVCADLLNLYWSTVQNGMLSLG